MKNAILRLDFVAKKHSKTRVFQLKNTLSKTVFFQGGRKEKETGFRRQQSQPQLSLTLWVPAVQDGEGDGAMHLVLAGDNGGVEESPLGSIIQGVSERDGRTEVDRLYHQIHTLDTTANQLSIVPFKKTQ